MNHDYTHCIDYNPDCPNECFRARLERDLNNILFLKYYLKDKTLSYISYAHLSNTDECPLNNKE